jgi:hypothetical protein
MQRHGGVPDKQSFLLVKQLECQNLVMNRLAIAGR